ncbi:hypothetical protein K4K49_003030 [Colletotrichum sp. SAR 10_70]|nr:hypothetical protein K4K50_007464 [Colletotrichum sp. SAR 10_71]KAI8173771.1 hypothetical protein K4K49_003030 [Colletotrichum sp. SAR 10_70]KAJ4998120.1 hypothetical protein K4K48_005917 [Colletotrichum sp. SAR 10_66]
MSPAFASPEPIGQKYNVSLCFHNDSLIGPKANAAGPCILHFYDDDSALLSRGPDLNGHAGDNNPDHASKSLPAWSASQSEPKLYSDLILRAAWTGTGLCEAGAVVKPMHRGLHHLDEATMGRYQKNYTHGTTEYYLTDVEVHSLPQTCSWEKHGSQVTYPQPIREPYHPEKMKSLLGRSERRKAPRIGRDGRFDYSGDHYYLANVHILFRELREVLKTAVESAIRNRDTPRGNT